SARFETPLIAGEARFHLGLLELRAENRERAVLLASEIAQLAQKHDLAPLRWRAALLVAAIATEMPSGAARAGCWARSMLGGVEVEFEWKQHALRLAAGAGDGEAVMPIEQMIEETTEFLRASSLTRDPLSPGAPH